MLLKKICKVARWGMCVSAIVLISSLGDCHILRGEPIIITDITTQRAEVTDQFTGAKKYGSIVTLNFNQPVRELDYTISKPYRIVIDPTGDVFTNLENAQETPSGANIKELRLSQDKYKGIAPLGDGYHAVDYVVITPTDSSKYFVVKDKNVVTVYVGDILELAKSEPSAPAPLSETNPSTRSGHSQSQRPAAEVPEKPATSRNAMENSYEFIRKRTKFRIGLSGMYDDNIYLTENNKKQDWITTLSPGVEFRTRLGRHSLSAGYAADLIYYTQNPDKNSAANQAVSAALNLNFPVKIRLSDTALFTTTPPASDDVHRIHRVQNNASASAEYEFGERFVLTGEYLNEVQDYRRPNYNIYDYMEQDVIGTFYYRFLPKTSALVEYKYGNIGYNSGDRDSQYNQLMVGITGNPTHKLTTTIKGGGQWRSYDNAGYSDFNGFVFGIDATERFSANTTASLSALRAVRESIASGLNYYDETSLSGEVTQRLWQKITLALRSDYSHNGYPRETTVAGVRRTRKDDLWSIGTGARYNVQEWLSVGADYKFRMRESNMPGFDYKDNQVSTNVKMVF